MRCKDCDVILSEEARKLKDPKTGEYYDLCEECLDLIPEQLDLFDDGDFDEYS